MVIGIMNHRGLVLRLRHGVWLECRQYNALAIRLAGLYDNRSADELKTMGQVIPFESDILFNFASGISPN